MRRRLAQALSQPGDNRERERTSFITAVPQTPGPHPQGQADGFSFPSLHLKEPGNVPSKAPPRARQSNGRLQNEHSTPIQGPSSSSQPKQEREQHKSRKLARIDRDSKEIVNCLDRLRPLPERSHAFLQALAASEMVGREKLLHEIMGRVSNVFDKFKEDVEGMEMTMIADFSDPMSSGESSDISLDGDKDDHDVISTAHAVQPSSSSPPPPPPAAAVVSFASGSGSSPSTVPSANSNAQESPSRSVSPSPSSSRAPSPLTINEKPHPQPQPPVARQRSRSPSPATLARREARRMKQMDAKQQKRLKKVAEHLRKMLDDTDQHRIKRQTVLRELNEWASSKGPGADIDVDVADMVQSWAEHAQYNFSEEEEDESMKRGHSVKIRLNGGGSGLNSFGSRIGRGRKPITPPSSSSSEEIDYILPNGDKIPMVMPKSKKSKADDPNLKALRRIRQGIDKMSVLKSLAAEGSAALGKPSELAQQLISVWNEREELRNRIRKMEDQIKELEDNYWLQQKLAEKRGEQIRFLRDRYVKGRAKAVIAVKPVAVGGSPPGAHAARLTAEAENESEAGGDEAGEDPFKVSEEDMIKVFKLEKEVLDWKNKAGQLAERNAALELRVKRLLGEPGVPAEFVGESLQARSRLRSFLTALFKKYSEAKAEKQVLESQLRQAHENMHQIAQKAEKDIRRERLGVAYERDDMYNQIRALEVSLQEAQEELEDAQRQYRQGEEMQRTKSKVFKASAAAAAFSSKKDVHADAEPKPAPMKRSATMAAQAASLIRKTKSMVPTAISASPFGVSSSATPSVTSSAASSNVASSVEATPRAPSHTPPRQPLPLSQPHPSVVVPPSSGPAPSAHPPPPVFSFYSLPPTVESGSDSDHETTISSASASPMSSRPSSSRVASPVLQPVSSLAVPLLASEASAVASHRGVASSHRSGVRTPLQQQSLPSSPQQPRRSPMASPVASPLGTPHLLPASHPSSSSSVPSSSQSSRSNSRSRSPPHSSRESISYRQGLSYPDEAEADAPYARYQEDEQALADDESDAHEQVHHHQHNPVSYSAHSSVHTSPLLTPNSHPHAIAMSSSSHSSSRDESDDQMQPSLSLSLPPDSSSSLPKSPPRSSRKDSRQASHRAAIVHSIPPLSPLTLDAQTSIASDNSSNLLNVHGIGRPTPEGAHHHHHHHQPHRVHPQHQSQAPQQDVASLRVDSLHSYVGKKEKDKERERDQLSVQEQIQQAQMYEENTKLRTEVDILRNELDKMRRQLAAQQQQQQQQYENNRRITFASQNQYQEPPSPPPAFYANDDEHRPHPHGPSASYGPALALNVVVPQKEQHHEDQGGYHQNSHHQQTKPQLHKAPPAATVAAAAAAVHQQPQQEFTPFVNSYERIMQNKSLTEGEQIQELLKQLIKDQQMQAITKQYQDSEQGHEDSEQQKRSHPRDKKQQQQHRVLGNRGSVGDDFIDAAEDEREGLRFGLGAGRAGSMSPSKRRPGVIRSDLYDDNNYSDSDGDVGGNPLKIMGLNNNNRSRSPQKKRESPPPPSVSHQDHHDVSNNGSSISLQPLQPFDDHHNGNQQQQQQQSNHSSKPRQKKDRNRRDIRDSLVKFLIVKGLEQQSDSDGSDLDDVSRLYISAAAMAAADRRSVASRGIGGHLRFDDGPMRAHLPRLAGRYLSSIAPINPKARDSNDGSSMEGLSIGSNANGIAAIRGAGGANYKRPQRVRSASPRARPSSSGNDINLTGPNWPIAVMQQQPPQQQQQPQARPSSMDDARSGAAVHSASPSVVDLNNNLPPAPSSAASSSDYSSVVSSVVASPIPIPSASLSSVSLEPPAAAGPSIPIQSFTFPTRSSQQQQQQQHQHVHQQQYQHQQVQQSPQSQPQPQPQPQQFIAPISSPVAAAVRNSLPSTAPPLPTAAGMIRSPPPPPTASAERNNSNGASFKGLGVLIAANNTVGRETIERLLSQGPMSPPPPASLSASSPSNANKPPQPAGAGSFSPPQRAIGVPSRRSPAVSRLAPLSSQEPASTANANDFTLNVSASSKRF